MKGFTRPRVEPPNVLDDRRRPEVARFGGILSARGRRVMRSVLALLGSLESERQTIRRSGSASAVHGMCPSAKTGTDSYEKGAWRCSPRLRPALTVGSLRAVASPSFCQTDSASKKSGDKPTAKAPQEKRTAPTKKPATKTGAPKKRTTDKSLLKDPDATETLIPTDGQSSPIIIEPTNDKVRPTEIICSMIIGSADIFHVLHEVGPAAISVWTWTINLRLLAFGHAGQNSSGHLARS